MPRTVIDTSVWIEFLRHGAGPACDLVEQLVTSDEAVVVGPVVTELLQEIRSKSEAQTIREYLESAEYIEVVRADWDAAGEALHKLRARGRKVPLSDALISVLAARRGLPILSLDKHFDELPAKRVAVG